MWGTRILTAVEKQERLLSDLVENNGSAVQNRSELNSSIPGVEGEDLETLSRRDTPWTPITGSDMILSWSVFPRERPVTTFPSSAYSEKPKLPTIGMCFRVQSLSFIFMIYLIWITFTDGILSG